MPNWGLFICGLVVGALMAGTWISFFLERRSPPTFKVPSYWPWFLRKKEKKHDD